MRLACCLVLVPFLLAAAPAGKPPELGANQSLNGRQVFPADDPWNTDISKAPVDPNSAKLIASIGVAKPIHPDFGTTYQGQPNGIPYVIVDGRQAKVPVTFEYKDES